MTESNGTAGTATLREENSMTTTDAMEWLTKVRKLDAGLLEDMGIRTQGDRVAFQYRADGKPYGDKYRTISKRFWFKPEGVSHRLYNLDSMRREQTRPIILTEGEIDCLSVMQAGFDRSVSLPDGWTEKGNKTESLLDAEALLRESPCVIVAGDSDKAGESLPRTVANILKGHTVKFVTWPDDCKDANEVLMKFGESEIARCIDCAEIIDPPGGRITGFSDLPPMSHRRLLRVGEYPFDDVLAFELGAISVGTGIPGSGKTTFITWACDKISKNENVRIGFLSFETHPHQTRDHLSLLNGGLEWRDMSAQQKQSLSEKLDDRWRLVHRTYDADEHHMGWLESMVETLAVRDGCKLIVIDPWNELEHLPNAGESMTQYINWALRTMREWASRLEIHINLQAHPAKMRSDGKMRIPNGYDIADSAAFANKPSLGYTVHVEDADDGSGSITKIQTWKVRDTRFYGFNRGTTAKVEFDQNKMVYRRMMA